MLMDWSETKNASTSIYPPQTPISVNSNITLYLIFGDKLPDPVIPTETTTTTEEKQEEKPSSTTTEKPSEETTAVTT